MWIVVVIETYYPSVLHYDSKEEAYKSYYKNKGEGFITHIAEVEETYINKEREPSDGAWDVEWYGVER